MASHILIIPSSRNSSVTGRFRGSNRGGAHKRFVWSHCCFEVISRYNIQQVIVDHLPIWGRCTSWECYALWTPWKSCSPDWCLPSRVVLKSIFSPRVRLATEMYSPDWLQRESWTPISKWHAFVSRNSIGVSHGGPTFIPTLALEGRLTLRTRLWRCCQVHNTLVKRGILTGQ